MKKILVALLQIAAFRHTGVHQRRFGHAQGGEPHLFARFHRRLAGSRGHQSAVARHGRANVVAGALTVRIKIQRRLS
jgi:hypothetical protein